MTGNLCRCGIGHIIPDQRDEGMGAATEPTGRFGDHEHRFIRCFESRSRAPFVSFRKELRHGILVFAARTASVQAAFSSDRSTLMFLWAF